MDRLVILIAGLVVLAAWLARAWFWSRVQAQGRRMECSLTVSELHEQLGVPLKKANDFRDAAALGNAMRDAGMKLLEADGDKLAKKRRLGWWNLRILPVLVVVVLVFTLITQRFSPKWVLAGGCFLVALHVVLRVSGLGIELAAVKRARAELERAGGFRRISEEEAVLNCARASVWDSILPW